MSLKGNREQIWRYLPLAFACVLLAVLVCLAPWDKVIPLLRQVSVESLLAMVALAAVYYAAKAVRFWVMLRLLGIDKPFGRVAQIYMAAQPMTILPGGELYRTVLLEQRLGVPKEASAPTVTLQGLIEAVVLLAFSLAGALALGRERAAVLGVAVALALLLLGMRRGWFDGSRKVLNKLPFVEIGRRSFDNFIEAHQTLLRSKSLGLVVMLSLVPVGCGIGIFYIAATALGAPISLGEASIGYALPVVLSGLSFLPGGIGASEGSTLGILALIGIGAAAAFAITLLIRVFTLGAGILFGLAASALMHVGKD